MNQEVEFVKLIGLEGHYQPNAWKARRFTVTTPSHKETLIRRGILTVDLVPKMPAAAPSSPATSGEVADYQALATGRWVPVLTTFDKSVAHRNATLVDGIITVRDGHAFDSSIHAVDGIIRARIRKQRGQTVMLTLRDLLGVYYSAYYRCDETEAFGFGMRGVRFRYGVKKEFQGTTRVKEGEFFELAFAIVGDRLSVYADGKLVGAIHDTTISRAGGVAVHTTRGVGVFRDVEVMLLDRAKPAVPANGLPRNDSK
jgi:hypothetical protein